MLQCGQEESWYLGNCLQVTSLHATTWKSSVRLVNHNTSSSLHPQTMKATRLGISCTSVAFKPILIPCKFDNCWKPPYLDNVIPKRVEVSRSAVSLASLCILETGVII